MSDFDIGSFDEVGLSRFSQYALEDVGEEICVLRAAGVDLAKGGVENLFLSKRILFEIKTPSCSQESINSPF